MKPNIRHLSSEELTQFLTSIGEPVFRKRQIEAWLWVKHATSFEEMTNLSKPLRKKLNDHFAFLSLQLHKKQKSKDGTIKFSWKTPEGFLIESVLIPTTTRMTACVSSQVGCSLACAFCATGMLKRERNLFFDEIIDQFFFLEQESIKHYERPLSNVVFMGMGEPLLNKREVTKSIDYLSDKNGRNFSSRRITVSTVGLAKQIRQLGDEEVRFELAVSIHATHDKKRNKLMSINQNNQIETLVEALHYFYEKTGSKITLEYTLMEGINDSTADADELTRLYRRTPAKLINVIAYNSIPSLPMFRASSAQKAKAFITSLETKKVNVHFRQSRGKDIAAACGQLAGEK